MNFPCYFCQKPTTRYASYHGCVHSGEAIGIIHVRHFYDGPLAKTRTSDLHEVTWKFKYKRKSYEVVYWIKTSLCVLYRSGETRELITLFNFIPDWTPENCQEKLSKVLAFA